MTERRAMERALSIALGGWGRVAPNPLVGAVLCRGDQIIAEGYHAEYGGPHAEIVALAACEDPHGATCVVTLEPCAHQDKTPPCVDALVEAGISRVVYGIRDPHRAAGGGANVLRQHGVDVEEGLHAARAAALNAPFLFAHTRSARPFVALKVATSLDGYLADESGRSQWISGAEARDYVHWLRAGFDAIAVGRNTAEIDNPLLTVRGPVTPRRPPERIVVTTSGIVRPDLEVVRTANEVPTTLIVGSEASGAADQALRGTGVRILVADGLAAALHSLRAGGVQSLLVEGGGGLARALLAQDLVDRVYWIQAPIWLRAGISPFAVGQGRRPGFEDSSRWTPTERKILGDDTLLVVDRALCLQES